MGFIGAPIATAISFNLISIMSICYGVFFTPKTAWHPLSPRMFKGFGILVQLGLGGVGEQYSLSANKIGVHLHNSTIGQTTSEWWAWEIVTLAASL